MQEYVMFGIMGICLGIVCIVDMRICKAKYVKRTIRCTERTLGTVISEKTGLAGRGWKLHTVHSVEARFETADGTETVKETCSHKNQIYKTGDKIEVLYDPKEPSVCIFPSDNEGETLQATAALSYGIGFVLLGLGIVLSVGSLLFMS